MGWSRGAWHGSCVQPGTLIQSLELDEPHLPSLPGTLRRGLSARLAPIEGCDGLCDDLRVEAESRARSVPKPHRTQIVLVRVHPRPAHAVAGGHPRHRQARTLRIIDRAGAGGAEMLPAGASAPRRRHVVWGILFAPKRPGEAAVWRRRGGAGGANGRAELVAPGLAADGQAAPVASEVLGWPAPAPAVSATDAVAACAGMPDSVSHCPVIAAQMRSVARLAVSGLIE